MAKHWDQYDYKIAGHFLSALINGDESGLEDEEAREFGNWQEAQEAHARAAGFTVGHWDCDDGDAEDFGECDACGLRAMRATVRLHVYREDDKPEPAPAPVDSRPRAYRIEWLHGYDTHAPEVHPREWFHYGHGFDDEDQAAIDAMRIGERVRLGGPCDAVRIICVPAHLTDWDPQTLQAEALSRELPFLRIALLARHDSQEAREEVRRCVRECRALYACIAYAEEREAAQEEQEQQERYEAQSGR